MNFYHRLPSIILFSVGALLAGCGKTDPASSTPAASAPAASTTSAGSSMRSIEITADDMMRFSLTEIRAIPGEVLRITLKNTGRMPKQAMAHNWVLLQPMSEGDVNAFSMAAAGRAPEFLPADRSAIIANTKLLGSGESDTIEVTAPARPGEYPFLCTFPGHVAVMKGKFVVN